jgi:hypothetical protein
MMLFGFDIGAQWDCSLAELRDPCSRATRTLPKGSITYKMPRQDAQRWDEQVESHELGAGGAGRRSQEAGAEKIALGADYPGDWR